jgi:long-subunit fatty acid transport protein
MKKYNIKNTENSRSTTTRIVKTLAVFLFLFLCFSVQEFTRVKPLYTYYNTFYGARSLSMGNAFTAVADDLTAVFRNPAGIAEFDGPQIYLNFRSDRLQYNIQPQGYDFIINRETYTYGFDSTLKNLDFFSISVPVYFWDINWNFAFSYYRYFPYGFRGDLTGDFQAVGDVSYSYRDRVNIEGSAGIDVLGFTSAFYLTDYFSFGITLQQFINSGSITYTAGSDSFSGIPWSSREEFVEKIKGRNWVFGLIGKLTQDIVLGISYHTPLTGTLESKLTYDLMVDPGSPITTTSSTKAAVVIPMQLSFGLLLRPYSFMRVAFEYSKFYWSKARLSNYYGSEEELRFPVRGDTSSQEDTENYRLGVEFKIPLERAIIFLRGGLFSDQQLFIDASSAVVKFKGYSLGLGIDISSMVKMDIGYMRQKGTWNEPGYYDAENTFVGANSINDIISVSLTFSFGKKKEE